MNIIWSALAIEDLNDIEEFIARDNPARAVSFINELIDLGDSLSMEEELRQNGFVTTMYVNCSIRTIRLCTRFVSQIL